MLAEPKLQALKALTEGLSRDELVWVNGYVAACINAGVVQENSAAFSGSKKITIAYGTETGNAKKLATEFAAKAKQQGWLPKLVGMDQYRLTDLPKEELFVSVISTQGEGEPPIAAQKFYDHINKNGFKVPNMKYAVLALGDTSYPMFCKTGEELDEQFGKLGGTRIYPLQMCDLDYEEPASTWFAGLLNALQQKVNVSPAAEVKTTTLITPPKGKQVFEGRILSKINLNAVGSAQTTFHIEIEAEGVEFSPGDSIGVVPQNDVFVVDEILTITGLEANKKHKFKNEEASLRTLLINNINIGFLLEKFVKTYVDLYDGVIKEVRADLIDLLRQYPLKNYDLFTEFLLSLHAIAPRIYNICSSPYAAPGEVHIIALKDVFAKDGSEKIGLCSAWFEDKEVGDIIPFFIQTNKRFRLPADDKDVIMIGPGTGVAPFRCFVWERDVTGATGKNWLLFSNNDFTTDFYYQTEWQNWFGTGVLTNITLAFTNRQQHITQKIIEQGAQLFEWVQQGASLFLCGEKEPLSKQIEASLLQAITTAGKFTETEATAWFEELKSTGRYMKDVY